MVPEAAIDTAPMTRGTEPVPNLREGTDMRLKDRVAIVVGAGQSPGEGIGNGRATALTFAREGAKVLCADHNLASAQETADMIGAKGGTAVAFKADVTKDADIKAMVADAHGRWAASTFSTIMSASASAAAMPSCWRSPKRHSIAACRST